MSKNRYNFNDNEFQHVKKLLRELPKEKAADNFEYNLMVKIKNGNFEELKYEKRNFSLWKILVPVTGIVTAVFLFFFLFNVSEENSENLFQTIPQLRTEISGNLNIPVSVTKKVFGKRRITSQDVVLIEPKETDIPTKVITKKKIKSKPSGYQGMAALPFKIDNSTNLDAVVHNNNRNNADRRATLAGMNSSNSRFDGFFLGEEIDRKEVEAMKARIDSIKKMFFLKRN
jgi:hypothetical protein